MSKIVSILLLLISLVSAKNHADMYTHDVSDVSKEKSFSIDMTFCSATFGTHHGLYLKLYQAHETKRTCKELAPLFKNVIVKPYHAGKRKAGKAGSIGFGEKPNQCQIELEFNDGQMTGTPYGDKTVCSDIRSEGTIVLQEHTKKTAPKKEVVDAPYVMQILKYGSPHGIGQTFPSKILCDAAQVRLSKENAGLDYTYKCAKK